MAEYRLDLQLPDFLMLPEGWVGEEDEEEGRKGHGAVQVSPP